jgi:type IV pilus assembly protein PilO
MSDQPASPWRERLASPLTWHYAGFAVLLLVVIGLGVRLGLDWAATNSRSNDALAGKQVELKAMDLQTAPLRGLDKRVEVSREQIQDFYARRIPPTYSAVSAQIGELEVKTGVRLSRLQYSQGKPGANLTEISLDAGISGEYPDIMKFINSLERDQTFFVIRAMQLAGQQGGQVNLRLRVSTWLRPMDAAASGLPPTPALREDGTAPATDVGPDNSAPSGPVSYAPHSPGTPALAGPDPAATEGE